MLPLRQAAVRLLTTQSVCIATRPRNITTFASLPSRSSRFSAPIQLQRRWASGEAEAKKEEELPISQLQPTPQEEVENAVHEDNAGKELTDADAQGATSTSSATEPQVAESANLSEATDDATTTATEPESVRATVDRTPSARDAAATLTEGITDRGTMDARRPFKEPATPKATVYVGNLFFDVTENDLAKEFQRYGEVKKTRLIRDVRGLSKGFGYIEFANVEQAQKAIDELNQQLFEGRRLMVSFAHFNEGEQRTEQGREPKPLNPPSKTLFIGNMSFEMTDRDLNNLFRGIRNVIDVRVAIDRRTGQPRGFAHADFVDVKSAMEAMKVLAGKENYGRKLRVDYSYGPSTAPRNTPR